MKSEWEEIPEKKGADMWKIVKLAWKNKDLKKFLIILAISLRNGKISKSEKERLVEQFTLVIKSYIK